MKEIIKKDQAVEIRVTKLKGDHKHMEEHNDHGFKEVRIEEYLAGDRIAWFFAISRFEST